MSKPPERVDGPTPNGGAYSLMFTHADGSMEIVEYDEHDVELMRTYGEPPRHKFAPYFGDGFRGLFSRTWLLWGGVPKSVVFGAEGRGSKSCICPA
jgi:hypothetical protein